MTKLNYTNRKSEGVKLGSIVAKDLVRRTKTPASATAAHTPIDLNLEGKDLTDDGIAQFASTLSEVLTPINGPPPARLQFLHLQHNSLTTRALAMLAPCINAAAEQLEELDLSNNNISVDTEANREDWVKFLHAFARCTALQRLCLSNNDLGAFQAFEGFTQVYVLQFQANLSLWEDDGAIDDDSEDELLEKGMEILAVRDTNIQHHHANENQKLNLDHPKRKVRGLPAVPVISFENVSMTDAGALFLSRMIEHHKCAQVDINRRVWMRTKEDFNRAMVETSGNPALTTIGLKMLSEAETVPFSPFTARDESIQDSSPSKISQFSAAESTRRTSAPSANGRARSSVAGATDSGAFALARMSTFSDLTNYRKRVQRGIIENPGVKCVQLWHTSLRLLYFVRTTMMEEEPEIEFPPLPKRLGSPETSAATSEALYSPSSSTPQPTYASKLMFNHTRTPSGSPILCVVGEATTPVSPTILNSGRPGSIASRSSPSMGEAASTTVLPHLKGAINTTTPEPKMVGPFPSRAWVRVLQHLVDPLGILSEKQVNSVVEYGADRRTLTFERELLGKSDSVQVWKVLDQMDCLVN